MFSKKRHGSYSGGRGKKSSSPSGKKSRINTITPGVFQKTDESDGFEANFNREENNVSGFAYNFEKKERRSFSSKSGGGRKFKDTGFTTKKNGGRFGKSVKSSSGKSKKGSSLRDKEWDREKPEYAYRRDNKYVKNDEREKKFRGFSHDDENKPPRAKKRNEKYNPGNFVDFSNNSDNDSTAFTDLQTTPEKKLYPTETIFSIESLQIPEHLMDEGRIVFGSKTNFKNWLMIPNASLGNIAPATLLNNKEGRKIIEDELMRISFGVFA